MKLSTRSRYGLRLMLELASNYKGDKLLLKEISRRQSISEKYLAQIVIPLVKNGLIQSSRGNDRGYSLSKKPSDISVKRVVEVLEGDLFPVECVGKSDECASSQDCATRKVWVKMYEAIIKALSGFTLEDLLEDFNKCNEKTVMYHI